MKAARRPQPGWDRPCRSHRECCRKQQRRFYSGNRLSHLWTSSISKECVGIVEWLGLKINRAESPRSDSRCWTMRVAVGDPLREVMLCLGCWMSHKPRNGVSWLCRNSEVADQFQNFSLLSVLAHRTLMGRHLFLFFFFFLSFPFCKLKGASLTSFIYRDAHIFCLILFSLWMLLGACASELFWKRWPLPAQTLHLRDDNTEAEIRLALKRLPHLKH